jgi:hypothetical protein
MSFYGTGADLYEDMFKNSNGIDGCSKSEVIKAIDQIGLVKKHKWYGGTSDRELVRDVMLYNRGTDVLDLEHGQWIEKNLLGRKLTRERIKQYWEKHYEGFGIKITKKMRSDWEKRLDQLGIKI